MGAGLCLLEGLMKVGIQKRRRDRVQSQPNENRFSLERLESRICPSSLNYGAVVVTPSDPLTLGGQKLIELTAGKAIVYVSETGQGNANQLDANDIVGISVTKGIQLISNVNIHGDIVTNLNKNGTLSGENHDGSVLLAKANIGKLTINGTVDGQILAGGSIGGNAKIITEASGLLTAEFPISITGSATLIAVGAAAGGRDIFEGVNAIVTGVHIVPVTLEPIERSGSGVSIGGINLQAATTLTLIQASDAGPGGRGGDVFDLLIEGPATPYTITAGDGGSGTKAGAGGSIQQIIQTGSGVNGLVQYRAGSGGAGLTKTGGEGGRIDNLSLGGTGQNVLLGGEGGDGGINPLLVSKADGGLGGSIKNVRLEGSSGILMIAGGGGNGDRNGGQGGSVLDANNQGNVPALFTPTFVANGDFDNDGDLDLLTLSAPSDNFTIYLNDGEGDFVPRGIFATGLNPQRVAIADVNEDDNLDLFITNKDDDTVGIYLGNGDGTFDTPVTLDTGIGPIGVAVTQVNSDTDDLPDLVVVNSIDRTASIFIGTGGGSFDPGGFTIIVSDVGEPNVLLAANVNGDTFPDLVIANPDENSADVDTVVVFVGNGPFFGGDGTFSGPTNFPVGDQPSDIAGADLNGDGQFDVVTSNEASDNISILFGNTSETFPNIAFDPAVNIAVGNAPSAVGIVNLNGGLPDIVVANFSSNTVSVLLNQGNGTFGTPTSVSVGNGPISLTTGDFNGDGNQDVVTANSGSTNLSLLFGNGDGTFQIAGQDTAGAVIQAGNGGTGHTGNGGNGGFIGLDPGRPQPTIQGPVVTISALAGSPFVTRAGNGGDGFINGGRGGTISAVDLKAGGTVLLHGGTGGDGETGDGGSGGDIGRGASSFDVLVSTSGGQLARVETGNGGNGAFIGGDAGKFVNTQLNAGGDVELDTGSGGNGAFGGGDAGKFFNSQLNVGGDLALVTGSGGNVTVSGSGGDSGQIDLSEISAGGIVLIQTGDGGESIANPGKNGGSITNSSLTVNASTDEKIDVQITLGDGSSGTTGGVGGHFRNDTLQLAPSGSELSVQIETGSGGAGITLGGAAGEFASINLTASNSSSFINLYVDLGRGGDATAGPGGDGGSLNTLHASGVTGDIEINNVTGGNHGAGGNGLTGGAGGKVITVDRLTSTSDGGTVVSTGGTISARGGDGGIGSSGAGGQGGDVSFIKGEFQGVVDHSDIADTSGLRLLGGAGGASTSGVGGAGGTVSNIDVANLENNISYIAGGGGDGSTAGGVGGNLMHLTGNSSLALLFEAGNGGAATGLGGFGGNGGHADDIYQAANPGQLILQIAAGVGGDALALGGTGGNGGSINNLNVLGDIGDFSNIYGYNSMGGLFAGSGGIGQTADGANGSVTNVTAGRIAAIVAGTAVGPVPVAFLDNITASAIGANTDPDDPSEFVFPAFDFIDLNDDGLYTLGSDPSTDPAEPPIDGLILADVIGSIHLPEGVVSLFTYEVSNPPPIGNTDPHPVPQPV